MDRCSICGTDIDMRGIYCPRCGQDLRGGVYIVTCDCKQPPLDEKCRQCGEGTKSVKRDEILEI